MGGDVIKVAAKSRTTAVAGAIAGTVRQTRCADVQAIGAGAVNQAVKAVAIARGYLAEDGIDVICVPSFIGVTIGDQERTAMRLMVEPRWPKKSPDVGGVSGADD
jgi:stage V sporulation protein S